MVNLSGNAKLTCSSMVLGVEELPVVCCWNRIKGGWRRSVHTADFPEAAAF